MDARIDSTTRTRAFRGTVFHFVGDGQSGPPERVAELLADGLLVVRDGQTQIPNPDTKLAAGDEIIALTKIDNESKLRALLMS